ncbi:Ppx/GppA phosphatase family protein [Bacillus massiliigorillae]|uniref:Ppx/GppA phosphatase family protein n=1 Tax=Bacillus massiliigorillae TaxID=1243664 RepID=UPI00039B6EA7|nr:phosphatase [Bacillus massiliigorillae]
MIYGIIDVGSNTIRLNIYSYENDNVKSILHKKTIAGLAGYVKDGYLLTNGINTACEIINNYINILENFKINNIFIFATASFRNIVNTDEVVRVIYEQIGHRVDVITGEEEAKLDFIGATHALQVTDGMMVDIGGGSTELAFYNNAKVTLAVSLPIGSLSLFSKHVNKLFPKKKEKQAMKEEILFELTKLGLDELQPIPTICGVGGTIRAAKKLNNELFEMKQSLTMAVDNISEILPLLHKPEKQTLHRLLQIVPDRIHTITPGLLILHTIAEYFGSETIHVSGYGVREGYLYSKVLKEGEEHGQNESTS